jgi:hypothetical protein
MFVHQQRTVLQGFTDIIIKRALCCLTLQRNAQSNKPNNKKEISSHLIFSAKVDDKFEDILNFNYLVDYLT